MNTMDFNDFYQVRVKDTWTIYTKKNCIYCDKIKKLLDFDADNSTNIVVVDCSSQLLDTESRNTFLNHVKELAGYEYKTFPMVWYGDKFIGGYTDSVEFYNNLNKKPIIIDDDF